METAVGKSVKGLDSCLRGVCPDEEGGRTVEVYANSTLTG